MKRTVWIQFSCSKLIFQIPDFGKGEVSAIGRHDDALFTALLWISQSRLERDSKRSAHLRSSSEPEQAPWVDCGVALRAYGRGVWLQRKNDEVGYRYEQLKGTLSNSLPRPALRGVGRFAPGRSGSLSGPDFHRYIGQNGHCLRFMNPRFFAFCLATAVFVFAPSLSRAQATNPAIEAMLKSENLGGLKLGLPEKEVLKQLGKPESQSKISLQEADGAYVQKWEYPAQGLSLELTSGEKKNGAKTIASITASAGCKLATKEGCKIGSPESAVRKAYGAHESKEDRKAEQLVAGSIYGGIIFDFKGGKVSRIFFGAVAE